MYKGDFNSALFVLHTCDNPACVNPEHLFLGTHQDNSADKVTKNRQARGTAAGNVKLNEQAITEILASTVPDYSLAAQYGVSPATIHKIRLRQTWTHVPVPISGELTARRDPRVLGELSLA